MERLFAVLRQFIKESGQEKVSVSRNTAIQTLKLIEEAWLKQSFYPKRQCPDCCGDFNFLEDAHGGLSVNVKCAACGAKFNVCSEARSIERI
jgi:hypothetical protein